MEPINQPLQYFDVQSVALQDRNLIEASAGTGKTYSIAILVLRLLLEKKISINKILMVTFTKAAVAELEERIRLFVRNAYKIANGDPVIRDQTLVAIVTSAIDKSGKEEVLELLKEAKLLLDETAVMTIHSFCQVTLNEFALETNQLFGSDMVQDMEIIRQEQVNIFWRKQIATLHPDILQSIANVDFSRKSISKVIDRTLGGQRFLYFNPDLDHAFTQDDESRFLLKINEYDERINASWEQLLQEVQHERDELVEKCDSNTYTRKSLLPIVDDPHRFLEKLNEVKDKAYSIKVLGNWVEKLIQHEGLRNDKKRLAEEITNRLYCAAIEKIVKNIRYYKDENGLLSFDDLIDRLYIAINSDMNTKLIEGLREKYKAVFIDEFQDTDKSQYQIFDKAYGEETIVFYIGDPKQSIYAWRQADINTYFKAGREVERRYGMNINYRSSSSFIDSMNLFFSPTPDFDTFSFNNHQDVISYIPVEASNTGKELNFIRQGNTQPGITVFTNSKKEDICESVAKQVLILLTDTENKLNKNGQQRDIRPSDIGILVRSNDQGQDIKKHFSKYGIPSVTIDTNKVLTTMEAKHVYYLLKAIADINKYTISRALLSPFTGMSTEDLQRIDYNKVFLEFGILKQIWEVSGVYAALMKFIGDFNVKETLLKSHSRRTLTNLLQIIEILHKTQSLKNLSVFELMNWLKMASEGLKMEGDEYEQRIESDQDAVEIVTIHKSKGLEYNIVFAPFLDLKADFERARGQNKRPLINFRASAEGEYLFAPAESLSQEQQNQVINQIEQENRRLIYVAITRAVYKCYIHRNHSSYSKDSSLSPFINTILSLPHDLVKPYIEFGAEPEVEIGRRYQRQKSSETDLHLNVFAQRFELRQKNWVKMSYTYLARKPEYIIRENKAMGLVDYEHFIFKHLIRGNLAGNFLHHVFENIDFTAESTWETQIQASLSRYLPKQGDMLFMIKELIRHVLKSNININGETFSLSSVEKAKRLNELEFDFNVSSFYGWELNQLANDESSFMVRTSDELQGMMNGKIDMLFQHGDRYYILDWKSNFLGDALTHYEKDKLNEIMTENNYHLQYLIYVVAIKKYLEQRLSDFDYERDFGGVIYIFIRGARANHETGIYTTRPSIDYINKLQYLLSYHHV